MFAAKVMTPLERLSATFARGQLSEFSVNSHFDVLADLQAVFGEARRSRTHHEFDRLEVVRATIDKKMAVYKSRFWESVTSKRKEDPNCEIKFKHVIEFLADKAQMAALMGAVEKSKKPQSEANTNATTTSTPQGTGTWAERAGDLSKRQQQQHPSNPAQQKTPPLTSSPRSKEDNCGGCQKRGHKTRNCFKIFHLDADKVMPKMMELGACLKCGEVGHIAKSCNYKPTCTICSNNHLTILHKHHELRNKQRPSNNNTNSAPTSKPQRTYQPQNIPKQQQSSAAAAPTTATPVPLMELATNPDVFSSAPDNSNSQVAS